MANGYTNLFDEPNKATQESHKEEYIQNLDKEIYS